MQKMRKREGRVNRKREFIILSCCTRVCKDVDDVRNKNMLLALKMRKNLSDIFLFAVAEMAFGCSTKLILMKSSIISTIDSRAWSMVRSLSRLLMSRLRYLIDSISN